MIVREFAVQPLLSVWVTTPLAAVAFVVSVATARTRWRNVRYDAVRAWRMAGCYFSVCFALSIAMGVLPELIAVPATQAQLAEGRWWLGLMTVLAIVVIAYGLVWPAGTKTHGRKRDLPAALSFGLLWGLSEGQLFLCFWVVFESLLPGGWLVPVASFVAIATFSGLWHSQYWDIYVAPEHNDPAWNLRKVLFAHVPSLAATLCFLALTGNAALFVLFQTVALVLSSLAMRMPGWRRVVPLDALHDRRVR